MFDNRPWIALFSQTGSEIVKLSNRLGQFPDKIITNRANRADFHPGILKYDATRSVTTLKPTPSSDDYANVLHDNAIITLHGWMRIIPPEICDKHTIYNLHPGLINEYPELKGKDPQEQVFKMLNPPAHVGCVLHRATGELDSGPIILSRRVINHYNTPNCLITGLHEMSGDMWLDFFQDELYK